jgi:hypothetical protein
VPRTIDPEVAKQRSIRANAIKTGNRQAAERAAEQLDRAKRMAAINAAVRNAPPLTSEQLDSIVGMLRAAGGGQLAA